ncbi:PLP-dependent aspartate aminotransferase family protein [Kiloniella sp. EL199]|uniref:trans-sulfuration enzyme family protein n=1 Tax=Kiloniella sp. EL199 TaxID=2107581 RepID=UPI000EA2E2D1|nr:aminotransferase class I/II-fold pyridoxal phosphate-dependent enzyme [Kiloniella sp. EL199]
MVQSTNSIANFFLSHDEEDPAVSPALHQSLNYKIGSPERFEIISGDMSADLYQRYGNPNNRSLSQLLAKAEGAEEGMIFASGMASISTTMMALLKVGDHVVAQKSHYIGTHKLTKTVLPSFGVESTLVDQTSVEAFERALRPNTKLIMLETPSNPLLKITDLEAVATLARDRKILTFCDNTFSTPFNQRPIEQGVDIVMHSISKYIGGHHDLVCGAILTNHEIMKRIWDYNTINGAIGSPFNSWLALRGLRTLELRIARHNENAQALAEMLEDHPRIEQVFYPGLSSHPQHQLAQKQMDGYGGLLSFTIKGGLQGGRNFIEALKIPELASSLGGITSVAIQPAALFGSRLTDAELKNQGLEPGMVRLATGIEPTESLLSDADQALSKSA